MAEPVFPSCIPAFDKYLSNTVLGSEIDVLSHVFVGGTVASVWFEFGVINVVKLHRGQLVGVRPLALAVDHLPPYTHEFSGFYP